MWWSNLGINSNFKQQYLLLKHIDTQQYLIQNMSHCHCYHFVNSTVPNIGLTSHIILMCMGAEHKQNGLVTIQIIWIVSVSTVYGTSFYLTIQYIGQ